MISSLQVRFFLVLLQVINLYTRSDSNSTPLSSRLNSIKANPNNIWRPLSQSSSPSRSAIDELSVHLSWMEMIYGTFYGIHEIWKNSTRVLLFSFFFFGRVLACSSTEMICCLLTDSPTHVVWWTHFTIFFILINWIIIFFRVLRWKISLLSI